jgi:hypothetical protein
LIVEKRQANMDFPETAARGEAVPQESRAAAGLPHAVGRTYERFLELPPAFVLAVNWMVGVALSGSIALVLYLTVWALVRLVGGSI